jgi:hypothetical protein
LPDLPEGERPRPYGAEGGGVVTAAASIAEIDEALATLARKRDRLMALRERFAERMPTADVPPLDPVEARHWARFRRPTECPDCQCEFRGYGGVSVHQAITHGVIS